MFLRIAMFMSSTNESHTKSLVFDMQASLWIQLFSNKSKHSALNEMFHSC